MARELVRLKHIQSRTHSCERMTFGAVCDYMSMCMRMVLSEPLLACGIHSKSCEDAVDMLCMHRLARALMHMHPSTCRDRGGTPMTLARAWARVHLRAEAAKCSRRERMFPVIVTVSSL